MDQYALFGHPIKHSKSPFIHTLFAKQTMQQMHYQAIDVPLDSFKKRLQLFFLENGKGCNVTVPFKEEAFEFAQQLTDRAQLAGAVNTLKLTSDGQILGDNTDGAGLVLDLKNNHVSLSNARILLLGAGGAARGVCGPLLAEKPAELIIANRTYSTAQALASNFTKIGNIKACQFQYLTGEFNLIINATSASLSGDILPINKQLISAETTIYDMMYSAETTVFNHWASTLGAHLILDGLGMLVGQAAESFLIWRGIKPISKQVLTALRYHLMN